MKFALVIIYRSFLLMKLLSITKCTKLNIVITCILIEQMIFLLLRLAENRKQQK